MTEGDLFARVTPPWRNKMPNNEFDKTYTSTEVGTLVESFRNEIRVIAERIVPMSEDMAVLKEEMKEVKADIRVIKDVIRIEIPSLKNRVSKIETHIGIA